MPRILATATAVPSHKVRQQDAKEAASKIYAGHADLAALLRLFDRTGVETRYLVHPVEWYLEERSFDERNAEYVEKGLELLEQVVKDVLQKAKLPATQIEHLYFVTTTGLSTPSLDALLAQKLGFRPDVRRTPIFGLGCAGGVGAVARAAEICKAHPKHRALVLSLELCSLVFSTQALTPVDLVGASLFGDGAAAVLIGGDEVPSNGGKILFTRSQLFPGTEGVMGWDFTSDGMRLVLSQEVPEIVRTHVKPAVEKFVLEFAMTLGKIKHYILHPGGPRVLEAYEEAFGIEEGTLQSVRDSMRRHGNLSSAATLFLLHEMISAPKVHPGDKGVMVALGPGFAAEMALLSW